MSNKLRFSHPGYTLVSHLFRSMLVEKDMSTDDAEEAAIEDFYNWAIERREQNPHVKFPLFPDYDQLREAFDELTDENFELVEDIFESPFTAVSHLYIWWSLLCLSSRKPLEHKPIAISIAASIQYEDGLTAHFPLPLGKQSEDYSTGIVLTLFRGQMALIVNELREKGLDAIHDLVEESGNKTAVFHIEPEANSEIRDFGL